MLYHISIAKAPTLLEDLLEGSAGTNHGHCATIQFMFHNQSLKILHEEIGREGTPFGQENMV